MSAQEAVIPGDVLKQGARTKLMTTPSARPTPWR